MKPKTLRIYEALCPADMIADDDPRRGSIMAEVRAVGLAKSTAEAAKAVDWWGWDSPRQMMNWIRKARRMWAEQTRRPR